MNKVWVSCTDGVPNNKSVVIAPEFGKGILIGEDEPPPGAVRGIYTGVQINSDESCGHWKYIGKISPTDLCEMICKRMEASG